MPSTVYFWFTGVVELGGAVAHGDGLPRCDGPAHCVIETSVVRQLLDVPVGPRPL